MSCVETSTCNFLRTVPARATSAERRHGPVFWIFSLQGEIADFWRASPTRQANHKFSHPHKALGP
jgi:hypothetical protein